MTGAKEIKNRIKSVQDTQKITNAMYLISSTKMRKAKEELEKTRPYFAALRKEIKRVFRADYSLESQYYYPVTGEREFEGSYGYLVVTADKGLAGAYNVNVIKTAIAVMEEHPDPKLFVVGEYGRHQFAQRHIPIEQSFLYTAQNPSLYRARAICDMLLEKYRKGELKKIYVVYTEPDAHLNNEVKCVRLLPFHRDRFSSSEDEKDVVPFEYYPSKQQLLDNVVPSYVAGFIYSAFVSSFCGEQSARMAAMDSANRNAQKLLGELQLQYNHIRQSSITQEITEISSGARWQREKESKSERDSHGAL